jgi:hypothetical protein
MCQTEVTREKTVGTDADSGLISRNQLSQFSPKGSLIALRNSLFGEIISLFT